VGHYLAHGLATPAWRSGQFILAGLSWRCGWVAGMTAGATTSMGLEERTEQQGGSGAYHGAPALGEVEEGFRAVTFFGGDGLR
jgi:hypothetical protein